ncbi:GNAT family N-acetyltransferase [Miniphocaeibacter massiliensis]|uniref:GNAT family N-acetyltransferase n=1 Tax=Miniphocaeibacter massiliensis TaxID=2041841 RepID=UPI000C1BDD98|nr:GNAT family N-acetyltransferase [Miniphocaeibacter massiliensis]
MNHLGTVELETERLLLRRITKEDAKYAFENWMSDDEVTKYLRWENHKSVEESLEIISSWIEEYNSNQVYHWTIVLKEINEPIGMIGVIELDKKTEKVHIGYALGRAWWNNGIMTEAFQRIIKFLFEEVEVNRIESLHDPNNPGSGIVMKKSGLKYEGTLKQADWNNSGIVDAVCYGLISEDYFEE